MAPTTMAIPPIVGVPALRACGWVNGPSSRMSWPMPRARSTRMSSGVPSTATAKATPAAMRSAITGAPTPRASASATRSSPTARLALTAPRRPDRCRSTTATSAASASATASTSERRHPTRPTRARPAPRRRARRPRRRGRRRVSAASAAEGGVLGFACARRARASRRAPRSAGRQRGCAANAPQRGGGRRRARVVGVVEHRDAVRRARELHAPRRGAWRRRARRRRRRAARRARARRSRPCAAFGDLVLARARERHRRCSPHGVSSRNVGRSSASSVTSTTAHVGAAAWSDAQDPGAVRACERSAVLVVGVEDGEAVGRQRVEQLALHGRRCRHRPPRCSACASPMWVTTPTVGTGDLGRARRCSRRSARPSRRRRPRCRRRRRAA